MKTLVRSKCSRLGADLKHVFHFISKPKPAQLATMAKVSVAPCQKVDFGNTRSLATTSGRQRCGGAHATTPA